MRISVNGAIPNSWHEEGREVNSGTEHRISTMPMVCHSQALAVIAGCARHLPLVQLPSPDVDLRHLLCVFRHLRRTNRCSNPSIPTRACIHAAATTHAPVRIIGHAHLFLHLGLTTLEFIHIHLACLHLHLHRLLQPKHFPGKRNQRVRLALRIR